MKSAQKRDWIRRRALLFLLVVLAQTPPTVAGLRNSNVVLRHAGEPARVRRVASDSETAASRCNVNWHLGFPFCAAIGHRGKVTGVQGAEIGPEQLHQVQI